ncbi:MAG: winged helix-turn-helix domain-containing protein [Alphaproteobacteria bacterium]|nr:winged helix-turn-helix domain-containing protein [Alphaproteobacteria bacterium]
MSRTFDLADRLIYYVLTYLVKYGSTSVNDLRVAVKKDMKFNSWEKVFYEKSRMRRWERMMLSFSIDLTKAGWITKKRKIWEITSVGREALLELKTPTKLRIEAKRLFDVWNAIPREELLRRKAEIKYLKLAVIKVQKKRKPRA